MLLLRFIFIGNQLLSGTLDSAIGSGFFVCGTALEPRDEHRISKTLRVTVRICGNICVGRVQRQATSLGKQRKGRGDDPDHSQ
jgi:hypothetical protein